nr:hypothetical protein [Microbispora sp. GKU 823]
MTRSKPCANGSATSPEKAAGVAPVSWLCRIAIVWKAGTRSRSNGMPWCSNADRTASRVRSSDSPKLARPVATGGPGRISRTSAR